MISVLGEVTPLYGPRQAQQSVPATAVIVEDIIYVDNKEMKHTVNR